jgi:hypothetical protein
VYRCKIEISLLLWWGFSLATFGSEGCKFFLLDCPFNVFIRSADAGSINHYFFADFFVLLVLPDLY